MEWSSQCPDIAAEMKYLETRPWISESKANMVQIGREKKDKVEKCSLSQKR